MFGGCSCNLPWTGDDCALELLAPLVETPADVQVAEGSAYEHQLVLTQVRLMDLKKRVFLVSIHISAIHIHVPIHVHTRRYCTNPTA